MNALALVALVALSGTPETLRLSPGTQQTLKQPGVTRVAIADPEVAEVQATGPGELLVSARRQGKTSLILWLKNGQQLTRTIVVDDGRSTEMEKAIHDLVNPTLDVKTFNGKVVVDGKLDSMEEWHRLQKLVGDDPNVVVMAKLDPAVLPFVANQITQAFRRAGLQNATAVAVGGKILLEGSVTDPEELQKARTIASAYYELAF